MVIRAGGSLKVREKKDGHPGDLWGEVRKETEREEKESQEQAGCPGVLFAEDEKKRRGHRGGLLGEVRDKRDIEKDGHPSGLLAKGEKKARGHQSIWVAADGL